MPPIEPPAQTAPIHSQRKYALLATIALIALVAVTFGRTLSYGYVNWDDQETIFENPVFKQSPATMLSAAWTQAPMAIYMPVTRTAWAVVAILTRREDAAGALLAVWPYRCVSVGLHLVSTLLVFAILRRLFARHSTFAAWLGAALFAVHPLQVEALAWISGQKDLLAGFFTLLACWLAMRSTFADDRNRSLWLAAVWLVGLFAMLSKPQAVVVPAIIAALLVLCGIDWRRAFAAVVPLLLLAAVVAVVARNVQPADATATTALWIRPWIALDAVGWYLAKLIVPAGLALDYGRDPLSVWGSGSKWLFIGCASACIILVLMLRRRVPWVAGGSAIALIAVLPVLGFLPFDFQQYSTVADHYVYTAMFGLAIVVGSISHSGRSARVAAVIAVLALAVLSWRQAGCWRNSQTLFAHTLEVNPKSLAANRVLAYFASQRGDDRLAIQYLRRTLADHPKNAIASYNLANAHSRLGEVPQAIEAFETAIEAAPRNASYRHNYAIALIRAGRPEEAETQLKIAVSLDPRSKASQEALAKLQSMRLPTAP